MVAGKKIHQAI